MKMWLITILVLLLAGPVAASGDGGTRSPFSLGAGARDLALGGSNIAVCDMATAPFWNASRLARAEQYTLTGFHSRLYDSDVTYQYFGLVLPTLDFGTFGLGIFRLGVDGIEMRDAANLYLGETDESRLAFHLAYAKTLGGYDIGLAANMEQQSLDTYSSTSSPGLSLSAGKRIDLPPAWLEHATLAINAGNVVGTGIELAEENYTEPFAINIGAALGLIPSAEWGHTATLSLSMTKVESVDPRLAAGLEYDLKHLLHVRGGYRDGGLSFGVGLKYSAFSFDYAMVDRDLGSLHMFNVTSAFGLPRSVKRQQREQQREEQFNQLMSSRLNARNQSTVDKLLADGESSFDDGNLVEARNLFDRALFVARSNGLDTTMLLRRTGEVVARLAEVTTLARYGQYMDSAEAKYDQGDFLATRYFANLALNESPGSYDATQMISRADRNIKESVARDELIQKQLFAVDSLISYGQINQALATIRSLSAFAPEHSGVQLAGKRVAFERWREVASEAYDRGDFPAALDALDSVSVVFPDHQWCAQLRSRIKTELDQTAKYHEPVAPARPAELSPQMAREVEAAYQSAQEAFQKGELKRAIENWERVERLAPDYQSVREYLINAYKFVGVELYGENHLDEAVATWTKAAEIDPDNAEIANYIKRTQSEILKLRELSYDQ